MHVLTFLADQVPIPSAPVTIGPGAWLSAGVSVISGLSTVLTLLTTGRKWLSKQVAAAATKAVEANVLPKLVELTTAIDKITRRIDEQSVAQRSIEQRMTDLVLRVDAQGRRLDEHSLRLDSKEPRATPRTRRATT